MALIHAEFASFFAGRRVVVDALTVAATGISHLFLKGLSDQKKKERFKT